MHTFLGGCAKWNFGTGIECDQVYLGTDPSQQLDYLTRILAAVVHALDQDVLEGQPLARAQRELARGGHQSLKRPFARDGHDLDALLLVRRIQRNRQLRAHRLLPEIVNRRNDARGGHGHARDGDSGLFHQQPHGFHEIVVIEERLALPHEDQVHAFGVEIYAVVVQDAQNLTDDFSRGEVAQKSKQCGHAELAVDGASRLAGHADRRPPSGCPTLTGFGRVGLHLFVSRVASVSLLPVVAIGHPYRLNRLPIGELHQVADRPIVRDELLLDLGQTNRAGSRKLGAQRRRQTGYLFQRLHSLAVNRLGKLPSPVGGLPQALHDQAKLLNRKA